MRGSLLIPVLFCFIESRKHDRQHCDNIVTDQTQNVFVIPVIQGTLRHLQNVTHINRGITKAAAQAFAVCTKLCPGISPLTMPASASCKDLLLVMLLE